MTKFLKYSILVSILLFSSHYLKAVTLNIGLYPPFNNSPFFSDNENDNNKFTIYMSQGLLNIRYNKPNELENGEIIIYNLLGQEIMRKKLEPVTVNQISIPSQNTCYIIRIHYSGKVHTQKIIVNNDI